MFNDDAFSKIKKGARIINVARGGVIDDDALARALDAKQVAQVWTGLPSVVQITCQPVTILASLSLMRAASALSGNAALQYFLSPC